jgi:hypothetical protein
MILEHVAAILFFSGPLFYIGVWLALDPAGVASVPQSAVGAFRGVVRTLAGVPGPAVQTHKTEIPRNVRRALRFAGLALLLFALAL